MTSKTLWTVGGLAVLAIWAAFVVVCLTCTGCGTTNPETTPEAGPPEDAGCVSMCCASAVGQWWGCGCGSVTLLRDYPTQCRAEDAACACGSD